MIRSEISSLIAGSSYTGLSETQFRTGNSWFLVGGYYVANTMVFYESHFTEWGLYPTCWDDGISSQTFALLLLLKGVFFRGLLTACMVSQHAASGMVNLDQFYGFESWGHMNSEILLHRTIHCLYCSEGDLSCMRHEHEFLREED